MATVTISLPDPLTDWIESQVENGAYLGAGDYVGERVGRDRADREHPQYTLQELRRIVEESRASGISTKTMKEIRVEAREIVRARGLLRE